MRLLLGVVAGAALTIAAPAAAGQKNSALTAEETAPPDAPPAAPQPNPAGAAATSDSGEAASADRTALNLLGELNADSGESRRNENVQITLIDNGVLKELNERMGTTATVFSEFQIDVRYFGKEFGGSPQKQIHLPQSATSDFHGKLSWGHGNSLLSARSFFQVGDVQPARNNDYGVSASTALGKKTSLSIDAGQRKLRGQEGVKEFGFGRGVWGSFLLQAFFRRIQELESVRGIAPRPASEGLRGAAGRLSPGCRGAGGPVSRSGSTPGQAGTYAAD